MKLIIYACCREEDRTAPEQSVIVEWSNVTPNLNDSVSMGTTNEWNIVEVIPYSSPLSQPVETVYLAHVHRNEEPVPAREEWTSSFARHNENIHVELSGVGEPELQLGFNVLGNPPRIGDRLMTYEPINGSSSMRSQPTDWIIDSHDTFLPQGDAPYSAIHLSWCKSVTPIAA